VLRPECRDLGPSRSTFRRIGEKGLAREIGDRRLAVDAASAALDTDGAMYQRGSIV